MTGAFLCGCVLFPLVLLALSTGGGLLVRRASGGWLPGLLIAPVGFALLVSLCSFVTYISWLAPAGGYIALVVALAGYALEVRAGARWPAWERGAVWPFLAALVAFMAIGAPTLLTGTPTWTGYSRIVDIGFQMDFSQYLAEAGRAAVGSNSSYHANVEKLVGIGYPGGGQATLGVVAALIRTNLAWCYQMYHAFAAAMGALAIYSLLGKLTRSRLLRTVGAAVSIQPNVMYAYALEGGIKELTAATLIVVSAAVFAEGLPGPRPHRSVLPAAVGISGAVGAFSVGVAPWLGLLLLGLFIVTLIPRHRLRAFAGWVLLAAVTIVISLPGIISYANQLSGIVGSAIGGTVDLGLGNLAAAVPDWSAAGVWLTSDYRFPLVHVAMTHRLDVFVIVLAVIGIAYALLRRRWVMALLGISAPIALYYYIEHSSAWIQFKSFTITGVLVLTLAFAGAAALREIRWKPLSLLGWLAAAIIAGGVLYGNATVYHDITLAPAARYHDLAAIDKQFSGEGPTLFPAFDEYAEYFLHDVRGSSFVVPANDEYKLRPGVLAPGAVGFSFNLNQFELPFLQSFHLVVLPRGPLAVRPPSNWDLVRRSAYFDVWRRTRPASDVIAHLPLSGLPHERTAAYCRKVQITLHQAGSEASLAYVPAAPITEVLPTSGVHPDYWKPEGGELVAYGAGSDRISFTLSQSTRSYELWMLGTVGRPLRFFVDGKAVGAVAYEERYPGQMLHIGTSTLAAGRHTLVIERGGGSLHPGSGDDVDPDTRELGPILIQPRSSQSYQVKIAAPAEAPRVCAAPVGYEWMEVVRNGAVSATSSGTA
ncbi:MAG TPA: hypothetical protein VHT29_01605 [Solirubrobacteraceae bacterium]|jgi:hypothetical protein|nr:hypothetical protein [Solirubrobacteraceae bacterium]